jgi:DNA processing protein
VIEAGERSGARITARHAAEQSRDVYAVPGPIDSPLSIQTNRLISQGAKLVATSADLFEDLIPGYIHGEVGGRRVSATEVSSEERAFLSHFERDLPRGADELVEELKRPVSEVLQVLLELQVKGLVVKQADARYVRVVGEV